MKAALLALAALLVPSEPVPERLPPVERCSADASFSQFRNRLRGVIASKDEHALLAMLAGDVLVDFGGGSGAAAFAANWDFDQPGESRVWDELREALALGCAQAGDALAAPSFVVQFPHELDAFETVIVVPLTRLRTARSDLAEGLGTLDWHLASVTDDSDGTWLGVRLGDRREGYVRRDQVISPLDFRLIFEKRDGEWKITAFVAGD